MDRNKETRKTDVLECRPILSDNSRLDNSSENHWGKMSLILQKTGRLTHAGVGSIKWFIYLTAVSV